MNFQSVKQQSRTAPRCCPSSNPSADTDCCDTGNDAAADAGSDAGDQFAVYDHPHIQAQFLVEPDRHSGVTQSARLQLENIRCAGCCGAIEKAINTTPGISSAELNYSSHQLQLSWDSSAIPFSAILRKLDSMGYPAHPIKSELRVSQLEQQRKGLIRRIGVAGGFGMQIMVLSVCLYAGDWWGMEAGFVAYFQYLSLLLVLPIMYFSVGPFLRGAIDDLRHRRVGIDVPVSVGLGIAFVASFYATVTGSGETYFDSIAMFAFLVLGARLFEIGNRIKATSALGQYDSVVPDSACLIKPDQSRQHVPTMMLKAGDRVLIASGDVLPADGVIASGTSSLDESLLTGESMPVTRRAGDKVVAGSVNVENPLEVIVQRAGDDTMLSGIARLVVKSQFDKPRVNQLVEKLSSWFVVTVLSIASAVAILGYLAGSEHWLSATIAVLIVSCPCALALATPAAISMAMGNALQRGLLVSNSRALETVHKAMHFFCDKTGTLTSGRFSLTQIYCSGTLEHEQALRVASSLEYFSAHPIAQAFNQYKASELHQLEDVKLESGGGLAGSIEGHRYYLGNPAYILKHTGHQMQLPKTSQGPALGSDEGTLAVLADADGVQCTFVLQDQLRAGAREWVQGLLAAGAKVTLLSGDRHSVVASVAKSLGLRDAVAACNPQDKLKHIENAREHGEITAMIGDGLNDAPVIGAAHVSIAVGDRANLSTVAADIVVMNPQTIPALDHLSGLSRRLSRVIRQNLIWALAYNGFAIPFAALGLVPPWLAAIGMSLSSLLVVLNASRLGRWQAPGANPGSESRLDLETSVAAVG